jgi:glyoxylase-like metal-dependent hydrolase (beta-lactamase superfamily II)
LNLHKFFNITALRARVVISSATKAPAPRRSSIRQRDIDQYLAFADEHNLRIAHVFLTHFHADFLAGHLELRDRTGAAIYLGAAAKAEYVFHAAEDR